MEPMRTELPPAGYLEGVRELATRFGGVVLFDEVTSGFRISLGGVQECAAVTPDVSVAKAISNGYPMAAVVGKREFMEPSARMFISSAYWDDNVGITAALATLQELQRRDAVAHFERLGTEFKTRINAVATQVGALAKCVGIAAHPRIGFMLEASERRQEGDDSLHSRERSVRPHPLDRVLLQYGPQRRSTGHH